MKSMSDQTTITVLLHTNFPPALNLRIPFIDTQIRLLRCRSSLNLRKKKRNGSLAMQRRELRESGVSEDVPGRS